LNEFGGLESGFRGEAAIVYEVGNRERVLV